MKKGFKSTLIVALLCSTLMLPSCIGKFALTNKLISWNQQIGNKFVNELVFFAFWVLPVYEVAGIADVLVLNSIEFWSGDNPVASSSKKIKGSDGDTYLVESDSKGYNVTNESDGTSVRFDYDSDSSSWNVVTHEGESYELMTFVDDTHVSMPAADGSRTLVELSQEGVMAYEEMVQMQCFMAKAD